MAIIEDNSESLRKCDWCGKSGIKAHWSGKKGLHCSFRCSAAGGFRTLVLISVISLMMTGMMVIMMLVGSPNIYQIDPFLIIILAMPVTINLIFIYAAYIGRSMRKERSINL